MKFELIDPFTVMLEYLKLERSLTDFYSKNMDCSSCGPKDCCCSYSSGRNSGMLYHIIPWDHFIAKYSFPSGRSIIEAKLPGDHCPFLSEKGCVIKEGKPNICTTFLCESYEHLMTGREMIDILGSYTKIGDIMSDLMVNDHNEYKEINGMLKIDSSFRISSEAIGKGGKFERKFEYKSILT